MIRTITSYYFQLWTMVSYIVKKSNLFWLQCFFEQRK